MADINNVVLVGRLTRNAELKYTNTGFPVSKVSIAVNKKRKKDDQWIDEVNYFDVTIWGKTAENLQPYLLKGKQVGIQGELKQDRWEQDGQSRSKVEVVATNVMLLGGKSEGGSRPQENRGTESFVNNNMPETESGPATDGFVDDIPF